ncbi:MAG: methylated-DNA--[protein]-cysteine S-methyltransferase [Bacteroidetes bacterium]|nr:methylated-DNA--[protein]-cysteine S-methyltransferase [Bacteroidota bacterium]
MSDRTKSPASSVYTIIESPIGPLTLVATDAGLRHLIFGAKRPDDGVEAPDHPILTQAEAQLAGYFSGERTTFDVPLDMVGTPFQKAVWALLEEIPYGTTTSYGALAEKLGGVGKSRAVGLANGRNPVALIVPCHRVIGTSGALTGFGGGLEVKAFLLQLEQRRAPAPFYVQADMFAGA